MASCPPKLWQAITRCATSSSSRTGRRFWTGCGPPRRQERGYHRLRSPIEQYLVRSGRTLFKGMVFADVQRSSGRHRDDRASIHGTRRGKSSWWR